MKNIVLKISGFLLIALFAISSCMEDPIKEAQEDYDYSKIVPVVLAGIQGPNLAVQTFTARERLAIEYTRRISSSPLVFPAEHQALLRAEFSERELVILATTAAQVNYWARVIQALGIAPAGFTEACRVPPE